MPDQEHRAVDLPDHPAGALRVVGKHGVKNFHHPAVGDLTLAYETLPVAADADLTVVAYSSEPGSPSEDALGLLASWAATVDHEQAAAQPAPLPRPQSP
ncbi:hypothetical protein [Streptomyces sp. NPDC091217]|uniref:MmyB family transcriptional regulator n=1 Tax=Streptomyces sp. NPDC091217 TaxID=3365975 RepID=UPI00382C4737